VDQCDGQEKPAGRSTTSSSPPYNAQVFEISNICPAQVPAPSTNSRSGSADRIYYGDIAADARRGEFYA
jgi:hypothetical protein